MSGIIRSGTPAEIREILESTASARQPVTGIPIFVTADQNYFMIRSGRESEIVGNVNGLDVADQIDIIENAFRRLEFKIRLISLETIEPRFMEPAIV